MIHRVSAYLSYAYGVAVVSGSLLENKFFQTQIDEIQEIFEQRIIKGAHLLSGLAEAISEISLSRQIPEGIDTLFKEPFKAVLTYLAQCTEGVPFDITLLTFLLQTLKAIENKKRSENMDPVHTLVVNLPYCFLDSKIIPQILGLLFTFFENYPISVQKISLDCILYVFSINGISSEEDSDMDRVLSVLCERITAVLDAAADLDASVAFFAWQIMRKLSLNIERISASQFFVTRDTFAMSHETVLYALKFWASFANVQRSTSIAPLLEHIPEIVCALISQYLGVIFIDPAEFEDDFIDEKIHCTPFTSIVCALPPITLVSVVQIVLEMFDQAKENFIASPDPQNNTRMSLLINAALSLHIEFKNSISPRQHTENQSATHMDRFRAILAYISDTRELLGEYRARLETHHGECAFIVLLFNLSLTMFANQTYCNTWMNLLSTDEDAVTMNRVMANFMRKLLLSLSVVAEDQEIVQVIVETLR
jgi:hypothetical protein